MVEGPGIFKNHFKAHTDHYILIGGSACDWQLEQKGFDFRATKDLDIILVAEALSVDFVRRFWQFIRQGGYTVAQIGEQKKFYRFIQPKVTGYPKMLELFSRKPDLIAEDIDKHKRDVIRVTAALTPGDAIATPSSIKEDLQKYIALIREENPDVRQILRADVNIKQILELIMQTFGLESSAIC